MIPGNSGAELCFLQDSVIKAGDERLEKSCKLQQNFSSKFVSTPKVEHIERGGVRFAFMMERIKNATTIFKSPPSCLDKLFGFILDNLRLSRYHSLPASVFVDKINSIDVGEFSWYAERLKEHFANGATIPIGPMHGDLTFCNVLCKDEHVWLIDFLDGFISSPVMDVAKMRQDSFHGWIELFDDAPNRACVDARIMETFGYLPFLDELTLLSLLRIAPYAKTEAVTKFLRREIPRAYNNLDGGRR